MTALQGSPMLFKNHQHLCHSFVFAPPLLSSSLLIIPTVETPVQRFSSGLKSHSSKSHGVFSVFPQASLLNWTPKQPTRSCGCLMTAWPWIKMKALWRRVTLRSASAERDRTELLATSSSTAAAIIGRFCWEPPRGELLYYIRFYIITTPEACTTHGLML